MPNKTLTYLWGHIPFPRRVRTALIWLLSPKFTVGVVALVRNDEGRILLLRHTYRLARPWGLPGGGLKPGTNSRPQPPAVPAPAEDQPPEIMTPAPPAM